MRVGGPGSARMIVITPFGETLGSSMRNASTSPTDMFSEMRKDTVHLADEERHSAFSVQNQVNRSGLVYTVMICDVLGIVADVNDAWDGTNTGAKNLCPIKPQVC